MGFMYLPKPLHAILVFIKGKTFSPNDFGNNFGNKAVVLLQSLIKPLTMAERVGYSA
jgi:hypothetical protein